ncbi:MAG: hypothetical protein KFB96_17725 [Thiocapsa sp.]|nr:hypothetical protein [Thiocapsa sp.]QVL47526.1 MAG: hypothetical protein KFB96_17725 [Thiocapsa sp.]
MLNLNLAIPDSTLSAPRPRLEDAPGIDQADIDACLPNTQVWGLHGSAAP